MYIQHTYGKGDLMLIALYVCEAFVYPYKPSAIRSRDQQLCSSNQCQLGFWHLLKGGIVHAL